MFEELRGAFREAIANFKEELHREEVPHTVDGLLLGMRHEAAQARSALKALADQIEDALQQAAREAADAATCRRREALARKVDDEQTVEVAVRFAVRHERRQMVMERKAAALEEERVLRAGDLEEMLDRIRDAQAKRDELAATLGADEEAASRAADDLFEELDRMAGTMNDSGPRRARSARTVEDLEMEYEGLRVDPWATTRRDPAEVEQALDELKRRMGLD